MEAMSVTQRVTAREYLAWDGPRGTNLVEGEVVVGEPRPLHQEVLFRIAMPLRLWTLAASGRGHATLPIDVLLDDGNVYAPDVLWYSEQRRIVDSLARPQALPDLAVEVRSPSTWRYGIGAKKAAYERHGLPELWLVDTPAQQVLVFRRSRSGTERFDLTHELGGGEALASPLLPGFALEVGAFFELA